MVASISYIEKTIDTYRAATEVNLTHAARVGNIVVLTPELADEVMITGDLHGHRRNFNLIRRLAALDDQPAPPPRLQEVCHGGPTYPQRRLHVAHDARGRGAAEGRVSERVHFILGNHELAELTDYPIQKNRQMLNLLFRLGMQQMYGPATEKVREAYLPIHPTVAPWQCGCPAACWSAIAFPERADTRPFDRTVFTRELEPVEYLREAAGVQPGVGARLPAGKRQAFAEQVGAEVIVNGHEPCQQGYGTPNSTQVILDSCNDRASYVMLGITEKLTHAEIVARIGASIDMPEPRQERPRGRYQFSIAAMLLTMTLAGVLLAALVGLLRGDEADKLPPGFYYVMVVAAPLGVVILIGVWRSVVEWWRRR